MTAPTTGTALTFIPHTIVVANGKGGVGKTSLVSNLAGLFAAGSLRTLTIDLDPQGNLARDMGYDIDDGADLFQALLTGSAAPIITDVAGRTGLDAIPGGPNLSDIVAVTINRARREGAADSLPSMLWRMLTPLADTYDVILIDTPPGDAAINDAALAIAHSVLIPTRADEASLDGLAVVAERFARTRQINPTLRLLGVALFGIGSRSSRLTSSVRDKIDDALEGTAPIFESRIRYLESAAADQRNRGQMIHELEGFAEEQKKARLAHLKSTARGEDTSEQIGQLYARNAEGLAADYESLAREVLSRQAEIDKETL